MSRAILYSLVNTLQLTCVISAGFTVFTIHADGQMGQLITTQPHKWDQPKCWTNPTQPNPIRSYRYK